MSPTQMQFPAVTRIEVIDHTGRAFTARYDTPGVSFDLQDGERTLKVFTRLPDADSDTKAPLTSVRDAIAGGLTAAHEYLGKPQTVGAILDGAIDRVRGAFSSSETEGESAPEEEKPTEERPSPLDELKDLMAEALGVAPEKLSDPTRRGGSLLDVIADHIHTHFVTRKD